MFAFVRLHLQRASFVNPFLQHPKCQVEFHDAVGGCGSWTLPNFEIPERQKEDKERFFLQEALLPIPKWGSCPHRSVLGWHLSLRSLGSSFHIKGLWSQRAPNSTETQKELKWLKSDSGRPTPKWPKIDSKVTPDPIFESLLSHFWVISTHPGRIWPPNSGNIPLSIVRVLCFLLILILPSGRKWADPGVLWKKAPRAMRAMRGKTLETVPFQLYFGCTESFLKVLSN